MYQDPLIIYFVLGAMTVIVAGLAMGAIRQPMITGYIIAGFALGPGGSGLIQDQEMIGQLGAIGVVLLLFFIGMEVSPRQIRQSWRVALIGTLLQIVLSMALVGVLGWAFDWPLPRTILIGLVVSLSCTAIVVDHLKRRGEMNTRVARDTVMILIAQDILVIPMLILLALLGGSGVNETTIILQLAGGTLMVALLIWVLRQDGIELPWVQRIADNPEMQVFLALLLCFGLAFITGLFQLSTALGAFVAGIIVGQARSVDWVRSHLDALRVVFVAIFFASIGMLIDIQYLKNYWWEVGILVAVVLLTNTFINAGILRFLGQTWPESLYAGALLAHIGEFSFVLAAVGFHAGIVGEAAYQITMAVIALSLALGPGWVMLVEKCLPGDWRRAAGMVS